MFYKLINGQRQTGQERLNEFVVDGEHLLDPDGLRQGWVDYFKALGTPIENGNLDENIRFI